jgi:signal peptidase I
LSSEFNEQTPETAVPLASAGPEREKKPAPKSELVDFLKIVALIVVLLVVTREFVIEGYEVQGPSMNHTLATGDRILVFKLPFELYKLGLLGNNQPFTQADIIVFDGPDDSKKRYVKRLIAQGPPGHGANTVGAASPDEEHATKVRIADGAVYVDNKKVVEDYLNTEDTMTRSPRPETSVRSGEYFMLGDNRVESKDSRVFGPVQEKYIIGRAVLRFWPLDRFSLLK